MRLRPAGGCRSHRLFHQDRNAGFQLRRLDRHRQAPAKARFQTILNAVDLFWITIRSEDDLLITFQQGVKGVEELFLRTLFIGEELNIIDQQGVNGAVIAFKFFDGVVLQGFLPCPARNARSAYRPL